MKLVELNSKVECLPPAIRRNLLSLFNLDRDAVVAELQHAAQKCQEYEAPNAAEFYVEFAKMVAAYSDIEFSYAANLRCCSSFNS